MSTRKSVILFGSILLLAIVGLVIVGGLVIGPWAMRPSDRPAHLPLGTTNWALDTPVAYVIPPTRTTSGAIQALPSQADTPPTAVVAPSVTAPSVAREMPSHTAPIEASADSGIRPETPPAEPPGTSVAFLAPSSARPTATPVPGLTPSAGASPIPRVGLTPTSPAPSRISGRLLLDGTPASGTTLRLEDHAYDVVVQTKVKADGSYVFPDLEPSTQGYNLVFAQKWNKQYKIDQVISWGWIGPVAVGSGADIQLPDFDISLQGFGQVDPEPNAALSAAALSSDNPLQFEWATHPQAVAYWVDLARDKEDEQEVVWQSSLSQADSFAFDGRLEDGEHITHGDYWWGVGARSDSGPYPVTVYGYLSALRIKP